MELQPIIDMIMNQGIWCALFCYMYFTTQKEGKVREEKLYKVIDSQGDKLSQITVTLSAINERLADVEQKINE